MVAAYFCLCRWNCSWRSISRNKDAHSRGARRLPQVIKLAQSLALRFVYVFDNSCPFDFHNLYFVRFLFEVGKVRIWVQAQHIHLWELILRHLTKLNNFVPNKYKCNSIYMLYICKFVCLYVCMSNCVYNSRSCQFVWSNILRHWFHYMRLWFQLNRWLVTVSVVNRSWFSVVFNRGPHVVSYTRSLFFFTQFDLLLLQLVRK